MSALCDPLNCSQPGSSVRGDSPGRNTGAGCQALLQGIFPTQGSNPGLLHCRRILYCLSQRGSPRLGKPVAYPFSRGASPPGAEPGTPALQASFLPAWLPGKPWAKAGGDLGEGSSPAGPSSQPVPWGLQLIHLPQARGAGENQEPPLASLSAG